MGGSSAAGQEERREQKLRKGEEWEVETRQGRMCRRESGAGQEAKRDASAEEVRSTPGTGSGPGHKVGGKVQQARK